MTTYAFERSASAFARPQTTLPQSLEYFDTASQVSSRLPGRSSMIDIDGNTLKELKNQGFTTGLAHSMAINRSKFPLRIWVVDNSGSMQIPDGHRILATKNRNDMKFVACSRWAELKECVAYHCRMSALYKAPTTFRLLNDPGVRVEVQQFHVAMDSTSESDIMQDVQNAKSVMNKCSPNGVTPLISHILEIQESIMAMAPELMDEGKRVAIILATDGLPTDAHGAHSELVREQFVQALRLLEGLPVWLVVRLCTDEEEVVDFYNSLDEHLELSLEVLDDFIGEAEEVYAYNPWLNYALPLHRCREMGFYHRIFDMLDERQLTKSELREFFVLLFGEANFDASIDPKKDWAGFLTTLNNAVIMESQEWHPIKKEVSPWIDLEVLNEMYGDSACSVM